MAVEAARPRFRHGALCAVVPLLAALCAFPHVADSQEDTRMDELRGMRDANPDKVIRLDDQSFQKFVLNKEPRPYSLFIFFDASKLRNKPELRLTELRREFGLASETYARHESEIARDANLFFCDVEFTQSLQTFQKIGVNSLPHLRFLPSGQSPLKVVNLNELGRTAESFGVYLRNAEGIDIGSVEHPPWISTTSVLLALPFLLVAAVVFARWILTRRTVFHDPRLWCLGALLVYFFSVSGGMHNIIRGMPLYFRDRQNPSKLVYFFQGSSTQLGVEGFTVGALYTVVGLLLAFATHYLPRVKSARMQRMCMLVCIAGSVLAVQQVVALNRWKTGYHIHAYWPSSWR